MLENAGKENSGKLQCGANGSCGERGRTRMRQETDRQTEREREREREREGENLPVRGQSKQHAGQVSPQKHRNETIPRKRMHYSDAY